MIYGVIISLSMEPNVLLADNEGIQGPAIAARQYAASNRHDGQLDFGWQGLPAIDQP